MNIIIADISFWQYQYEDNTRQKITGWIDFAKMRTQTPAVIIRAGQGSWIDIAFDVSWRNAKTAGLLRGSYWYYDNTVEPKKQAELYASKLSADSGELQMWCDLEDKRIPTLGQNDYGTWKHWYTFLERLKVLMPDKKIGIYTGYYFWIENTIQKGIPSASLDYFKQFPLWLAWYGGVPKVPKPWTEWLFHQFTDSGDGLAYGVQSKEIDLNYCDSAYLENQTSTDVPLPQENNMYSMTTISSGTRIRADHNVYANVISSVGANIKVSGDSIWTAPADGANVRAGDIWMHLPNGWMAYKHLGLPICKDLVYPSTDPTPEPPPVPVEDEIVSGVLTYASGKTVNMVVVK